MNETQDPSPKKNYQDEDQLQPLPVPTAEEMFEKPSRRSNPVGMSGLFALLLPFTFLLGLGAGFLVWGQKPLPTPTPVAAVTQSPEQAQQEAAQFKRYDIPTDDDPSIGPEDAPITIIEFSDYQCPFCKTWHEDVYSKIRAKYPDQVRFVYRDFPLVSLHPDAIPAAEAANCANEQGAFWEFHDRLFTVGTGAEAYAQYAQELDLDMDAFTQCVSERRYQEEVEGDLNFASNLGVNSTPTFFMNGLPIVGAQPFEIFDQIIQKELAGEFPK